MPPGPLSHILGRLLTRRVLLPFLSLLLALAGLITYWRGLDIAGERAQAARNVAEAARRYVDLAGQVLQLTRALTQADAPDAGQHLKAVLALRRDGLAYFDAVYQLDAAGRLVYMAPADSRFPVGFDFSREPFFRDARPGLTVTPPLISAQTGRPTAYLMVRLEDGSVLAGDLNLDVLQAAVLSQAGGATTFLVDQTGRLLAHPRLDWVAQQRNLSDLPIVQAGWRGPTTRFYFSAAGLVQGSVEPVPGLGWLAVSEAPVWPAYSGVLVASGSAITLTVSLWALLTARLGQEVRRQVIAPLGRLAEGARALAAGRLASPAFRQAAPSAFAEIQDLTESFLRMDSAVQARQAALEEREAQYRALFEAAPEAILVLDLETERLADVNAAAEALFRRPRAELLALNPADLSPELQPDGRRSIEGVRALGAQALAGEALHFEWLHRDAAGAEHLCEGSLARLPAAGRRLVRASLLDITARRQAEAALQRSEDRLRTLLENVQLVAIGLDLDGRVAFCNDFLLRLTGRTRAEVMGSDWFALFTPHDPQVRALLLRRLQAGSTPAYHENEIVTRAGDRRLIAWNKTLWHARDGRLIGLTSLGADITERRRLEAEQQALQAELERRVTERTAQLEAANRELEAFSYSISHDLRAPLRAINGYASILLEEHQTGLAPEAAGLLQHIVGGARRMGHLIDDLLAFSRLGRQSIRMLLVRPAEVAQLALEELRAATEGRPVEITIAELPECRADPALLRQVFVNLLSNALKFTRGRAPARIEVGCQATAEGPAYFVRDNGVGFEMLYVDKLFTVFTRLHSPDEFEGTGVGLAIVRRIVERHGGRVWAVSRLNEGATFYFTLSDEPVLKSEAPAQNSSGNL